MYFFLKHNILKILFIDIHNFKKKKILEQDEDETNDQQSDAEQTDNEGKVNHSLFAFLQCSRKCTIPGEGYIGSESSPTGVTDQHAANHETSVRVIRKLSMFSQHSNMLNEEQWNCHPVSVFWMQVRKFLLQLCKRGNIISLNPQV